MHFVLHTIPGRPQNILVKSAVQLFAKRHSDSEEKKHPGVKYLGVKWIELDVRGEKMERIYCKAETGDCLGQNVTDNCKHRRKSL